HRLVERLLVVGLADCLRELALRLAAALLARVVLGLRKGGVRLHEGRLAGGVSFCLEVAVEHLAGERTQPVAREEQVRLALGEQVHELLARRVAARVGERADDTPEAGAAKGRRAELVELVEEPREGSVVERGEALFGEILVEDLLLSAAAAAVRGEA